MENSIEFFLNTHLEWSLSHQDSVITHMSTMWKASSMPFVNSFNIIFELSKKMMPMASS